MTYPCAPQHGGWGNLDASSRRRLVQLARRFCRSAGDAEDAVHNALLVARQKHGQLRDTDSWWSWVCRIVVTQCMLLHRSEATRRRHHAGAAGRESGDAPPGASEEAERLRIVQAAIDELPPQQRAAVILRHLEEMPYERIAEILGVSQSTARVHVRAGREAIRALIASRKQGGQRGTTAQDDRA